jgi:site-specific DNA-adenine methylase
MVIIRGEAMANYGMPYKGSKSKIAQQIINILPEAEWFVDLFGGGGAMIDCAMRSIKYQKGIYNELEPLTYKGFTTAIEGGFRDEKRWISREEFFELKDTDPYVAICFSFGNDLKTYCYAKELEPWKRALHYARVFKDTSELEKFGIKSDGSRRDIVKHKEQYKKKYLEWLGENVLLPEEIERLQSAERLQSLESLQRLERLQSYNLSYEQVPIPENAVIYCDIPYKATNTYLSSFDYDAFYTWARNQKQDVFISEYSMPDDFYLVAEIDRVSLLSPNSRETMKERLYCNHEYKTHEQLSFW